MWIGPKQHKVVGGRLSALRQRAKFTQAELATALRKPQSFVSAVENGQRRVDLLEFTHIVRALGGDPKTISGDIFDVIDQMNAPSRRRKARL